MKRTFYVGKGFGKKKLEVALNECESGDVIVIESGHYFINKAVVCEDKEIELIGKDVQIDGLTLSLFRSYFKISGIAFNNLNGTNAVVLHSSSLTCRNVSFNGAGKYPLIYMEDSFLESQSSEFNFELQRNDGGYTYAVEVLQNSDLILKNSLVTSLLVDTSQLTIETSRVTEQLMLQNSVANSASLVDFQNQYKDYFALVVEKNSQCFLERVEGNDKDVMINVVDGLLNIKEFVTLSHLKQQIWHNDQSSVDVAISRGGTLSIVNVDNPNHYTEQKIANDRGGSNDLSAFQRLQNLHGLKNVKLEVSNLIDNLNYNKSRKEKGLSGHDIVLHSIFSAQPKTGTTTVAKLLGDIFVEYEILHPGHVVEVSANDLFEGKFHIEECIESATGGILFIHDAEALFYDSFFTDVLNECLKQSNNNLKTVIIFSVLPDRLQVFLDSNSNLGELNVFEFEDYTIQDLSQIGIELLEADSYELDKTVYESTAKKLYDNTKIGRNLAFVEEFNTKLLEVVRKRIIATNDIDLMKILDTDLFEVEKIIKMHEQDEEERRKKQEEREAWLKKDAFEQAQKELVSMVGLENVKEFISNVATEAEFNQKLLAIGKGNQNVNYHMVFEGNPGTGKTTVANIFAKIFYNLGILPKPIVITKTKADIVGEFQGQAETNVKAILKEVMGGVLFIDEAYQFTQDKDDIYGKRAIETLLVDLENRRGEFIVIFAGYTKEMEEFLNTNPGLRSRVPFKIEFPDYSSEDIAEIVRRIITKNWKVDEPYLKNCVNDLYKQVLLRDKSNGRWARNFSEKIESLHKRTLNAQLQDLSADIEKVENIANDTIDVVVQEYLQEIEKQRYDIQ